MKVKKSQLNTIVALLILVPLALILILVVASRGGSSSLPNEKEPSTSISMDVMGVSFSPDIFVVPVGKEITWKIRNAGASGCTNRLIGQGIIPDSIDLGTAGDVKEVKFTLNKKGDYSFSCWMGMVRGTIRAV